MKRLILALLASLAASAASAQDNSIVRPNLALEAGWTPYTPTLQAAAGTLGAYTVNDSAFKRIGKTIIFRSSITVTNNGTGSSAIYYGTPTPAKANSYISGLEQVGASGLAGYIQPNQSAIIFKNATGGGYPLSGSGPWLLIVAGTYEAP